MREKILNDILKAKSLYEEICRFYAHKLTKNILQGNKHTIETDIPRHLDNFISIINMVEQKPLFPKIRNIEDGVKVFSNQSLDTSIEKALIDTTVVSKDQSSQMSAGQILTYSQQQLESCNELLQIQIATAKLMG